MDGWICRQLTGHPECDDFFFEKNNGYGLVNQKNRDGPPRATAYPLSLSLSRASSCMGCIGFNHPMGKITITNEISKK